MADTEREAGVDDGSGDQGSPDAEELRRQVEQKYDFENFTPADMREMSGEEWEAAFDADTWITGRDLLDRVERDLTHRIASREVFARVERVTRDGEEHLLAYSDEGYALVGPDGSVEGSGTVLRDVEPTVALCSMESYDPPETVADASLPDPEEVDAGTGELGNTMLQVIAFTQILVGLGLFAAWFLTDLSTVVAPAGAILFVLAGLFLFVVVANARLSDTFRAEEYRDRLRAVEGPDRPEFVPDFENGEGVRDLDAAGDED